MGQVGTLSVARHRRGSGIQPPQRDNDVCLKPATRQGRQTMPAMLVMPARAGRGVRRDQTRPGRLRPAEAS